MIFYEMNEYIREKHISFKNNILCNQTTLPNNKYDFKVINKEKVLTLVKPKNAQSANLLKFCESATTTSTRRLIKSGKKLTEVLKKEIEVNAEELFKVDEENEKEFEDKFEEEIQIKPKVIKRKQIKKAIIKEPEIPEEPDKEPEEEIQSKAKAVKRKQTKKATIKEPEHKPTYIMEEMRERIGNKYNTRSRSKLISSGTFPAPSTSGLRTVKATSNAPISSPIVSSTTPAVKRTKSRKQK